MLRDLVQGSYVPLQGRDGHEVTLCREIVPPGAHLHEDGAVQASCLCLVLQGRNGHDVTFCRKIVRRINKKFFLPFYNSMSGPGSGQRSAGSIMQLWLATEFTGSPSWQEHHIKQHSQAETRNLVP